MTWEEAILWVLNQKGGVASLHDFYTDVSALLTQTQTRDSAHSIRAYLRRLKQKKLIKQVGLSLYALCDVSPENPFYETALSESNVEHALSNIPKNAVHGFIEGMLVDLGNFIGSETYTPDKHVVFNGKPLNELCSQRRLPNFTYKEVVESTAMIDVIWLQDGFPIKTFDVEQTTDFKSALLRVYQLRDFNTQFFVVAPDSRRKAYQKRLLLKPFIEIQHAIRFLSYQEVYDAYRNVAHIKPTMKNNRIFQ
jgi:hypothetical protein